MPSELVFAYLHYLVFATIASCLVAEWVLIGQEMTASGVKRVQRIDLVYGLAAIAMLLTGIGRVFTEKGWTYYQHNHIFTAKMVLFALLGLLSIYPSVRFRKWTTVAPMQTLEARELRRIRGLVHGQIAVLLLIPLSASLMARGYGVVP